MNIGHKELVAAAIFKVEKEIDLKAVELIIETDKDKKDHLKGALAEAKNVLSSLELTLDEININC